MNSLWSSRPKITVFWDIYIKPTSAHVGCNTCPILKRSLTSLNSKFSFSLTGCFTKGKELSLSYNLFIAGERIIGFKSICALWTAVSSVSYSTRATPTPSYALSHTHTRVRICVCVCVCVCVTIGIRSFYEYTISFSSCVWFTWNIFSPTHQNSPSAYTLHYQSTKYHSIGISNYHNNDVRAVITDVKDWKQITEHWSVGWSTMVIKHLKHGESSTPS